MGQGFRPWRRYGVGQGFVDVVCWALGCSMCMSFIRAWFMQSCMGRVGQAKPALLPLS